MDHLIERAFENLANNTSRVFLAGEFYDVIRPGALYPGLWGWDCPFHAIGLAYSNVELALQQIIVAGLGQDSKGMIPHILFYDVDEAEQSYYPGPSTWQNESAVGLPISGISQPPVHGFALERIIQIAQKKHDINVYKEYPALLEQVLKICLQQQDWWYQQRDPEDSGLVLCLHPWESGRDNAVEWDESLAHIRQSKAYQDFYFDAHKRRDIRVDANGFSNHADRPLDEDYRMFTYILESLRSYDYRPFDKGAQIQDVPFAVQDITINSFLQKSNEALLKILQVNGLSRSYDDAIALLESNHKKTAAAFDQLWCAQSLAYVSYDVKLERKTSPSNASFLPLLFDNELSGAIHNAQIVEGVKRYCQWSEGHIEARDWHALPSSPLAKCDQDYRYWRGPIWPIINYLLALGLYNSIAKDAGDNTRSFLNAFAQQTIHMIERDKNEDGQVAFHEYFHPLTDKGMGADNFGFTSVAVLEIFHIIKSLQNKES